MHVSAKGRALLQAKEAGAPNDYLSRMRQPCSGIILQTLVSRSSKTNHLIEKGNLPCSLVTRDHCLLISRIQVSSSIGCCGTTDRLRHAIKTVFQENWGMWYST
ncbi:hypothetical protein TNIN_15651 [Trichonephila inaurata madagascariensis]|uniref:Uncharacterized protein n=1 Tax=Trichonephila inaurata madagascariensis TaxID=2747483 RepID=A0A8X7CU00_9ARAC|nr:hypothetical protein TNIN_15651 [Trichonephila inaurata madagascariensis]